VVTLLYLAWQASPILAAGNGWPLLQHALPAAAGIALLTLVSGFYSLPALNLWRDEYLITVDPQCITLDMGPLPGKPHARFEHLELERLVVVQRQRKPLALPETFTYDLLALMSDGKQTKLAQGLRRPDEAIYIMQQVETLLQIENPE